MAGPYLLPEILIALSLISSQVPSTLSFHISNYETGSVAGEEIVHYTLSLSEPVVVVLISEEGDVDLYASPTHINSNPNSDDYELSSVSCGVDMLALIMSSSLKKYTLAIQGHIRYDISSYALFVIKPSPEDIRNYQVWDIDPETNQEILLIDADPMLVLNDRKLTAIVEELHQHSLTHSPKGGAGTKIGDIMHLIGVVLLKILEILLEILV